MATTRKLLTTPLSPEECLVNLRRLSTRDEVPDFDGGPSPFDPERIYLATTATGFTLHLRGALRLPFSPILRADFDGTAKSPTKVVARISLRTGDRFLLT